MFRKIFLFVSTLAVAFPLSASARPVSAPTEGSTTFDDDLLLSICINIEICDFSAEACHDSCYTGLVAKTCELELGARAKQDSRALAACQADVSARCEDSCASLDLASADLEPRWQDDDDDDDGLCIAIGVCINLNLDI